MKTSRPIFRRFSGVLPGLSRFGAAFGLLFSVVLAGGAVAGSFFVPTKALGVFVASAGCFAAGWLFSACFSKAQKLSKQQSADEDDARRELEKRSSEIAQLRDEVEVLRQERDHLQGQRIDINAVHSVLKVGLAEADMSITDAKTSWLDDLDSRTWVERQVGVSPTRSRYVGVLQRSFKATYGVDLMKLRVREEKDALHIAGIVPESIGFKNSRTKWLLRQIQTFPLKKTSSMPSSEWAFSCGNDSYEIDRKKPFEGSIDLNRTHEASEKQEAELADRIDKGIGAEFQNVNAYIRDMAQRFLRVLLAPAGKAIVFEDTPLAEIAEKPEWVLLEDFAEGYNRQLDALDSEAPS